MVSDRWGFLTQDPRKTFTQWSEASWKLITSGEVAIGMSDDMLKVTCGPSLNRVGAILSGNESEDLFECNGGRKFVMKGGKVVRFGQ